MTMITGVAIALLTLIVPLNVLLDLVNIGTLFAFAIVCAGVIFLRVSRPDIPRPLPSSPFVPLFPLLGIAFSMFLAVFGLTSLTWQRFIVSLLSAWSSTSPTGSASRPRRTHLVRHRDSIYDL